MEILFWGHGPRFKNEKFRLHKHDFTQIEIILSGSRRCKSPEDDILLRSGEAVIVPFNVEHYFYRPSDDLEYLSFKIRIGDEHTMPGRIFKLPGDPFVNWIINDLREIARNKRYNASPVYIELMYSLLNALINHLQSRNSLTPESPLLQEIRTIIIRYGARINVNLMAEELGMSVYKFRRQFKQMVRELPPGAINPSPQIFIKNEILTLAYKNLRESSVSIGELSDMLHFNNVYTFSRFFKNNAGLAPSEYRKKHDQPATDGSAKR